MDTTTDAPPEPTKVHRRWVGSFLSFLLPGAGLVLSGKKRTGFIWFSCFISFWVIKSFLVPTPSVPDIYALGVLTVVGILLTCSLLVHSFRAVPRLGVKGWLSVVVLVVVLSVLKPVVLGRIVRAFSIPTGGMEPTISPGDHIFVQNSAYWFKKPERGDVVIFRTDGINSPLLPKGQVYVKRVAGLPGEHIDIVNGRLFVDDHPIEEPMALTNANFAVQFRQASTVTSITIPATSYFVVGDKATNSFDSRYFGLVPRQSIIGRATKIYWPPNRHGDIR